MKINKSIEVIVCDHCGKELLSRKHLEISAYDYQPYENTEANTIRYNLQPYYSSWKMTTFEHCAIINLNTKNDLVAEHELISDFCNWKCFVEYVRGDRDALQEI